MTTNSGLPMPPGEPLDLYLDGLLTGEALAAFERRLESEPALREVAERQRALDERVRQTYRPPAMRITLPAAGAEAAAGRHTPAGRSAGSFKFPGWARYLAYAAVIAVIAGVVWQFQNPGSKRPARLSAGSVFARLMNVGFKPEFVCTTDEEFNKTMKERFGQGLLIASAPNIELIGWAYSKGYSGSVISTDELILMAKVDGKEALVFMDKKEHEPGWGPFRGIEEYPPPGMNVFRGVVGDMVLYELSSSGAPVLINRAYVPK
jgi:hypothetical protein